jgi:membrane-associated phospholipid phosphatase
MKTLLYISLLILLIGSNGIVSAQDTIQMKYPRITKVYFRSCFTDTRDFAFSPLHWKGRQWAGLGSLAVSGLLLYTQDEKIRNFVQSNKSEIAGNIAEYLLEPWGSGEYSVPLLGGMYVIGRWTRNDRASATALTAAKAAVISSLFVSVAKQIAHRHRPNQDDPANFESWDGPFGNIRYTGFPSGHSAMAFSIATVFASEYRETVWVPILSYTLAAGTALSRVYNDKHFSSDVLVGSVFGYITGKFLWKINRNIMVIPSMSGRMNTITLICPV